MKTVQRLAWGATIAIASPLLAFKPAAAAGLFGYSVSTVADPYSYDSQNIPSSLNTALPLTPTKVSSSIALPNGASANGNATGSAGTLKAYAFAQLPSGSSLGAINAQSHSQIRAEDQLTVTSSVLAPDTPVTLLFSLRLDGTLLPRYINGDFVANTAVAALFNAGEGQNPGLSLGYRSDSDPLVNSGSGPMQIDRILTGTITTAVGRQINLDYFLDVSAIVEPGYPVTTAVTDFGHTSHFFVDSQTADVILTAASGYNYASPTTAIPTPALLPGLIALGASVLRQRRKLAA